MRTGPEALISFFHDLFVKKSDSTLVQFLRYAVVGGIAFCVDFGVLYLLTLTEFFRHYYLLAATVSFVFGLLTSYSLSVLWVFHRRSVRNPWVEFLLFAAVGVVGLGLNAAIIWFCTEIVFIRWAAIADKQIRIIGSKVIATVIVYLWNFLGRKLTLFK